MLSLEACKSRNISGISNQRWINLLIFFHIIPSKKVLHILVFGYSSIAHKRIISYYVPRKRPTLAPVRELIVDFFPFYLGMRDKIHTHIVF